MLIKELLQPDTMIELGERVSGPLNLLHLKEQLDRRRQSPGESLTAAEPTIERLIPFKPETWEALNQLAEQIEMQGARVTPDQVVALLVESSLAKLESEARERRSIMATNWQIGDKIQNQWEIYKILRGGMGIVYVVYDYKDRVALAAKTFQDEVFARNPQIADRFTQEALAWLNLDAHQNVTRAYIVEKIEGKPFLFLEYIGGGDLGGWIGTPRLTEDLLQVLRFAIQFCDGMTHVLSKGVKAHRDIKPQNCLVTQDGTLKVTDFGLAKVFDDASADAKTTNMQSLSIGLTRTGTAAGTCTHMAPEQFDDATRVDVRADIYSFGVMLFQMVTGQLPFIGRTWQDFERLHKTQPVPALSIRDVAFSAVVETCLAKDPARRFADFRQVRERLAEIYEALTGGSAPQPVVGAELNALEWNNKGVSLSRLGRHEEALTCCDRALAVNPRYEAAWINKGNALSELGRHTEAITYCDHALQLNPHLEHAWNNKGRALSGLDQHEEALDCYDRAIELNPRYEPAWGNKGNALGGLGRHEEAIVCCDRAIELNPHLDMAWNNKGKSLLELGQYEGGLACFDHALELNPRLELAWHNKGVVLDTLGLPEKALECYDRALEINPRYEAAWNNKGNALNELERYEEALVYLDRALEVNSHLEQAWNNKGRALNGLDRYEEALTCYDRALELNPRAARTWVNKGVALLSLGRHEEAFDCYDRALELNPREERVWFAKGTTLNDLGRAEEALVCYDREIELNPHWKMVWYVKGMTLRQLERYEEAIACLDRVLELDSHFADAWYEKGTALNDLGRTKEAVDCYIRALEISPSDAELWFNTGLALVKSGRVHEALVCFEETESLGHPGAAEGIALCQRILEKQ